MNYPVAELFHSVQGEGVWTGTPMMFVRLAGCNVGRYVDIDKHEGVNCLDLSMREGPSIEDFPLLQNKIHSICTSSDGQRFLCDTDYRKSSEMSVEQILESLNTESHVCITGGEPFLHDLGPLVNALQVKEGIMVHVETSGTKSCKLPSNTARRLIWITCCPKEGLLREEMILTANEWKFLVGPGFDEEKFRSFLADLDVFNNAAEIFIQPINGVEEVSKENLSRCMDVLTRFPDVKLSAQCHKLWGVR